MNVITYFNITYLLVLLLLGSSSQNLSEEIEVKKLKEGVYVYQSFATYQGNRVSANGLILESSGEVVLVDTPWDNEQTVQLLDWVDRELGKPILFTVITHAHMDRIGGITVLQDHDIRTISSNLTVKEAITNGYSAPDISFVSDTLLTYGDSSLEAFYPGPGHTPDNTVVYLNKDDILYGGCFIKSYASTSLGNLEDAVLDEWDKSLKKVVDRYPNRSMVIPGHGYWKRGAIENTLDLLSKEH